MENPTALRAILTAVAIVLAFLVIGYVGGYFWLGEASEDPFGNDHTPLFRAYSTRRLVDLFKPLADIESFVRGRDVIVEVQVRRDEPPSKW